MEASRKLDTALPLKEKDRQLKVLLDARKLGEGGIGVYIENLALGLSARKDVDLSLLVRSELSAHAKNVISRLKLSKTIEDVARPHSIREMFQLGRKVSLMGFDVFHVPHYTLPLGVTIPSVVTLHDIIHVTHPQRFYYPVVARNLISSALKRATRVITVSSASKDAICEFPKWAKLIKDRLEVIPNAIDPFFLPQNDDLQEPILPVGLAQPFFLAVISTNKPHKGLADLLHAFAGLKSVSDSGIVAPELGRKLDRYSLVIAGQGTDAIKETRSYAGAPLPKNTFVLGSIDKATLRTLYSRAAALVIPGFAEGFGLPVLEAHAQGTPVIARPIPAVVELLSDRDVALDSFRLSSLQNALIRFVKNGAEGAAQDKISEEERFAEFSREATAGKVVEVYHKAYSEYYSS